MAWNDTTPGRLCSSNSIAHRPHCFTFTRPVFVVFSRSQDTSKHAIPENRFGESDQEWAGLSQGYRTSSICFALHHIRKTRASTTIPGRNTHPLRQGRFLRRRHRRPSLSSAGFWALAVKSLQVPFFNSCSTDKSEKFAEKA
jgi:hypothetical protein